MSYSFNVHASDKETVLDGLVESFDAVVSGQPVHSNDRELAQTAAEAALDLIEGNDESDFSVTVTGSITMSGDEITSVGVSINVGLVAREEENAADSGGTGSGDPDGGKP